MLKGTVKIPYSKLFLLLFFTTSLFASVFALKYNLNKKKYSQAGFRPSMESWKTGQIGPVSFYRTNFAIEEQGVYSRSNHTPMGFYDSVSNKTFLVYGGGQYDGKTPYSGQPPETEATDPYVLAYDHSLKKWEGPVKLGSMGEPKDTHNFPQIIIDRLGYLHVFYSTHAGHDIYQFTSEKPRDISKWKLKTIPNTPNAYVAPFVDNQGEIYLFFRSAPDYECDVNGDGVWGKLDEWLWGKCTNATTVEEAERWCRFYEAEVYIKSVDNGQTWSSRKILIDPGLPTKPNSTTPDCRLTANNTLKTVETIPNTTGYQTTYASNFEPDRRRNRLWITFVISRWHGAAGGHRMTNPYLIAFNFDNDTITSINGLNLGNALTRTEFLERELNNNLGQECCTIVKKRMPLNIPHVLTGPGGGPRAFATAITIENPIPGNPTVFYNDWITSRSPNDPAFFYDGKMYVFKRVWTGNTWREEKLDGVGDVSTIHYAEYRPGIGTLLYVKNIEGGSPPFNLAYQYPTKVYYSTDNYTTGVRLFADHSDWEVRGVSHLFYIANSTPALRATMVVPKYNMGLPTQGFMNWPRIGAHYIIGDVPLERVAPTPTPTSCQPISCTSWESMRVGDCSLKEWRTFPKPSVCTTNSDIVLIKNSSSQAVQMRYINIDNPKVYCNTILNDDPNWSYWEDYSDYKYWKISSQAGDKKICVQFKNICGQLSPVCGAIVTKTSNESTSTPQALDEHLEEIAPSSVSEIQFGESVE